jgi:hypothetical protein
MKSTKISTQLVREKAHTHNFLTRRYTGIFQNIETSTGRFTQKRDVPTASTGQTRQPPLLEVHAVK